MQTTGNTLKNANILCVGPDLEITRWNYQDQEMTTFFESYPELMLLDATYKLTSVRMMLYVMLCVGPNGGSEIVAMFLMPFEDCRTLSAARNCSEPIIPVGVRFRQ